MGPDPDSTVRVRPARVAGRRILARRGFAPLLVGAGLLTLGGGGWLFLAPRVVGPGVSPAPPPAAPTPPPTLPLLDEAAIQALRPAMPTMARLRENPRVFVLLFPDLEAQGAALNRAAALIEKAGLPRDRLLGTEELEEAIRRSGDMPATWFYGHDYRGTDLARFFAMAERDRVSLNEAELWVRDQLRLAQAAAPQEEEIALVSAASPGPRMDAAMRDSVLRHEIGHGHYFTIPGFARHVHRAWQERLTAAERAAFRTFLGREGYDTGNEDLMANETMAYLLFTPDPRLFAPHHVGMTEAAVERLRGLLRDGLPSP